MKNTYQISDGSNSGRPDQKKTHRSLHNAFRYPVSHQHIIIVMEI